MLGPAVVEVTASETVNIHIWAGNTAAGIHFIGVALFVAGLAIIRAHNLWFRGWPVLITLVGWILLLLGLFRMFFPERQLEAAKHTSTVSMGTMLLLVVGIFLTFKGYGRK